MGKIGNIYLKNHTNSYVKKSEIETIKYLVYETKHRYLHRSQAE